jgi:ribonuclease HII
LPSKGESTARFIPHKCIIEGDGKYLSIACASILAKTYRDDHMNELHEQFPHYKWNQNKAYATRAHRSAIEKHGITEHHRKSFTLLSSRVEMDL